jgi:uncharacterized protein (UPF0261 family)
LAYRRPEVHLPYIAVLATQDTKVEESEYLARGLNARGLVARVIDTRPSNWVTTEDGRSRAETMDAASAAIRDALVPELISGECEGVCVLAGATGAAIASCLLRDAPLGVPKVLISPVASGDTRPYIGASDTIVVSPVVDFVGRNDYVDAALDRVAALMQALVGAPRSYPSAAETHFAATAFGVTSQLVSELQRHVSAEGRRLAVFSANGTGGEAYERFLEEKRVRGAFDITLSELADELCGGLLTAGPARGTGAGNHGIPQIMMPGGIDFINFGPLSSVPVEIRDRKRVEHTKSVTLVRTSPDENEQLARMVATRARINAGQTTIVIPTNGFSLLSRPGGPLSDPEADAAFIDTILNEQGLDVRVVNDDINGPGTLAAVLEASNPWRRSM